MQYQCDKQGTTAGTMKSNKQSISQLLNFAPQSYLERTSRPIYAIVFLLPFIVFYELGTILIRTDVLSEYWQGRVAAFSLLQRLLECLGFGTKFAWVATPLAVVVILFSLQLTSRKKWSFRLGDILPMAAECTLLAVPLIVLSLFLNTSPKPKAGIAQFANNTIRVQSEATAKFPALAGNNSTATAQGSDYEDRNESLVADIVTGIGAGIYEELIFRLILICLLMMLFQNVLRLDRRNSIVLSVLISAALFSAYHHIDFLSGRLNPAEPFNLTKFIFRVVAGVYFAVLFAIRGFGIAAGTHAFYDILAVLINARFFQV